MEARAGSVAPRRGPLTGIRVIELADEQAEYCGLTLAGLGADVDQGRAARRQPHAPHRALLPGPRGSRALAVLLAVQPRQALDRARPATRRTTGSASARSSPPPTCCWSRRREVSSTRYGLGADALMQQSPALIVARVSPFGDDGPWADFKGSDLVHLALGGVMMNCGYDPAPDGNYDLPPIAPQMWHAFHIAGEQLALAIVAALLYRWRTGKGQHRVVRDPRGGGEIHRGRSDDVGDAARAGAAPDLPSRARDHLAASVHRAHQGRPLGDGEPGHAPRRDGAARRAARALRHGGRPRRGDRPRCRRADGSFRAPGPSTAKRDHGMEAVQRFVRAFTYDNVPWREAQEAGMLWAPLRKPHENAIDPHWLARESCTDVEHPELGRAFRYATSKWLGDRHVVVGRPARAAAERGRQDRDAAAAIADLPVIDASARPPHDEGLSPRGKPFPLHGIRILDFTWFLASAGGTRFLSAFGAESIKVELKSHPDTRMAAMAPVGGRAARDAGHGAAARRHRSRHGRAVQQQEPGQARHLAERAASEGPGDRAAPGGDVGRRRGRLLAGRARQLGPRLRRAARDQAGHHLRPAVGHGRAGHVRPLSHRGSDRELVRRLCRRCRDCRSRRCRPAGATRTSTGWAPTASRWRCSPRSSIARGRAKGSGSTPRSPRSGSSSAAPPSSTGRPTDASGHATATARRTSRRRRTTSIRAPATIAGSPSPASRTPSGAR